MLQIRNKNSTFKRIFENILGLTLSLYVIYSIFPSTVDDISFLFIRNDIPAEILSISRDGTSKNPIVLNIKYLKGSIIKRDYIFTNENIASGLQKGQVIEISYGGFFDEKAYIVGYAPGFFVMFIQIITILILSLIAIVSSKRLLGFFVKKYNTINR